MPIANIKIPILIFAKYLTLNLDPKKNREQFKNLSSCNFGVKDNKGFSFLA